MSVKVEGTTITMTKGDTAKLTIGIKRPDGTKYLMQNGDSVRFAMKKSYKDTEVLIYKDIPSESLVLTIDPDDTKNLKVGSYVYDVQLTKSNGIVDTFITEAILKLTNEVD